MVKNWGELYFPIGCGRTEGGVLPNKPVPVPKPTQRPTAKPTPTPTKKHQHSIKPAKPSGTVGCPNCQVRPKPQQGGTGGLGSPAAPGGVPVNQDLTPNYRTFTPMKFFTLY